MSVEKLSEQVHQLNWRAKRGSFASSSYPASAPSVYLWSTAHQSFCARKQSGIVCKGKMIGDIEKLMSSTDTADAALLRTYQFQLPPGWLTSTYVLSPAGVPDDSDHSYCNTTAGGAVRCGPTHVSTYHLDPVEDSKHRFSMSASRLTMSPVWKTPCGKDSVRDDHTLRCNKNVRRGEDDTVQLYHEVNKKLDLMSNHA